MKRILQIVGTVALVALLILVYRRTDWSKRFTPDGDLTLVAALIAFIAIIIQIRSSSKQVQDQIKAQRDAEREERGRQKRVVASAILFEIDGLYRWLLRDVRDFLRDVDPEKEDVRLLDAKPAGTNPFVVFAANAGRIGELDEPIVENVVRFYMRAQASLYGIERYDKARERYLSQPSAEWADLAQQWLGNVKRGLPPLILIAYEVCQQLCAVLSIRFQALRIAVAAEDVGAVRREITKIGDGAMFEAGG